MAPLEASSDSEYSDEDNIALQQQKDIDAGLLEGDLQAGEIFIQAGQLNNEKRLRAKEKRRREQELQRWEFPQLISSYQEYMSPALEYSKMVCEHVFGLDVAF